MVAKPFLVTGISQPLDGSEDGGIRNDIIQNKIVATLCSEGDRESDTSSIETELSSKDDDQ